MQNGRDSLHVIEEIFQALQGGSKTDCRNPANQAENHVKGNSVNEVVVESTDLKHGLIAEQAQPDRNSQRVRKHERNEGTRLKFEEQKFDRQQCSGDRSVEHRRQARSRAARQQNFSL